GYRTVGIARDIPALPSRVITDSQGRAFVDALIKTDGSLDGIEDQGVAIQSVVGDIAAARVPVDSLEALVSLPNVEFIQKARSYTPLNDISIPAIGASAVHDTGVDGSGVIVGIIDTGVDFRHPDFIKEDGTTRIRFICDQTDPAQAGDNTCPGAPDPDNPGVPGTLWDAEQINATLEGGNIVRQRDENGHGTHVLGSAAGGDSVYRGVAPGADLIVVKTDFMDNNIISALDFIDQKATDLGLPYVVNMSLGSQVGPHDGTDLLSQAINSMVGPGIPGKAVVVAAGNDGGRNVHASADLSDGSSSIAFSMNSVFFEVIDIWYDGAESFSFSINDPNGDPVLLDGSLGPGESSPFDDNPADDKIPFHCHEQSNTCLRIDHSLPLAANGDIEILVMFISPGLACDPEVDPTCPTGPMGIGTWTLNFTDSVPSNGVLDAWCGFFCEFSEQHGDDSMTVSEPGVAQRAITAGAFTTRLCWDTQNSPPSECYPSPSPTLDELAEFSSRGPTRSGLLKPDIAAPGQGVVSTLSSDSGFVLLCGGPPGATTPDGGHVLCQGTSMATAHVIGAAALMLSVDP
ncbi:MAG: S8 family serine peptidase, partial [Chloroflexi bacterium]|nr:S8 family serine peptidase [Chloroflexota bacterium]